MADIVTREQLENASLDCGSLEDVISGANNEDVLTRLGQQYPTLAKALYIIIQTGGFEPFLTQVELLASVPTLPKKVALALDTENLCYWNGSSWSIAGSIAMNSTVMKTVISIYDPALVYKGKASLNASAPSSPATNDTYIVVSNGTTFGIQAESGQLLIYNGAGWKVGDMLEVFNRKYFAIGGNGFLLDKNTMPVAGYINASGVFTASSGYKLSYFKPVVAGQTLKFALRGSASVSVIAFYDANFAYVSNVLGNDTNTERTVVVPTNIAYIRASNNSTALTSPYCQLVIPNPIDSMGVLKTTDLTIEPSLNLAKTEYIVNDKYVNNTGSISSTAGWKYISIPVIAGETYTFGRFTIIDGGYFAFYDASNAYISGTVTAFNNGSLPKTVVAPTGAAFLLIDIKRPDDTGANYAQLTVNVGPTLIDYENPKGAVSHIAGYDIYGTGGGGPLPDDVVVQGGNATLADITSDKLITGALIANLPTSPSGLESGQAYIDGGFIKVVT